MDEHVPLYASAYAGYGVREQVRQLTYGDDVGQSGWVTADELERFAERLELDAGSRLLDVGCGSGGPALRLAELTGARVVGIDLLEEGIATATRLAAERRLADKARFVRVDAGASLPFGDGSFDAVISIDVMCHLPSRLDILREWHRVTAPGARILFTDPTVVTGLVTDAEIADRSAIGIYVFSAEWVNETLLAEAGFETAGREDLTENMAAMAGRWHDARARFQEELVADEGEETFAGIQRFSPPATSWRANDASPATPSSRGGNGFRSPLCESPARA
ncbi:MAG TPA: methyltransferase domain-containing protein [Gaiellaceae bacterium]|nr:methyltransferase domain-containing protein [Gaiellaceae bacterium]